MMTDGTTDGPGPDHDEGMSRPDKRDAVLRLLRGEDPELVSRDLGVTAANLTGWRDDFLAAGEAALAAKPTDGKDFETARSDGDREAGGGGEAQTSDRDHPGGDGAGGPGKDGPAVAAAPATVPKAAEPVSEGTCRFMIHEPVLSRCLGVFEGPPPPLKGLWTPARERRAQRPARVVLSRDRVTIIAREGLVTIEKVVPTAFIPLRHGKTQAMLPACGHVSRATSPGARPVPLIGASASMTSRKYGPASWVAGYPRSLRPRSR